MNSRRIASGAGLIAVAFLIAFLLWPLAVILQRSLGSISGICAVLSDPWYLRVAGFTSGQALLSTALTLLAGLPPAPLSSRFDFPAKRLLRSAFTIPFVRPAVGAAMGFLALLGPRRITGVTLQGSFAIIMLAHVFYNSSLVIRIVGSYLEAVAPRLGQAALSLGASPLRVLWRLTLPLARPAILAAAALVFVLTFTSFGGILVLSPRYPTLRVELYRPTGRLLQPEPAAVLALLQLVVVAVSTVLYARWLAKLALPVTGVSQRRPRCRPRHALLAP